MLSNIDIFDTNIYGTHIQTYTYILIHNDHYLVKLCTYTTYVHLFVYIIGKYKIYLYELWKQEERRVSEKNISFCVDARSNKSYISRQCTCLYCMLCIYKILIFTHKKAKHLKFR